MIYPCNGEFNQYLSKKNMQISEKNKLCAAETYSFFLTLLVVLWVSCLDRSEHFIYRNLKDTHENI